MSVEPDGFEIQIAYQIKGFLTVLREVARSDNAGEAVSRLLVEVSQLLLAGGRLGALTDDLSGVASALLHGLAHWEAGREDEALWWWQFSYISSWGSQAATTLRALQSVLAHDRLDAEAKSTSAVSAGG
jgi:hypothetical protein